MEHPARPARILALIWIAVAVNAAVAQQSPGYRIEQRTLNAGGRPQDAVVAGSASYRVSLDAIGSVVVPGGLLTGTGYRGETGLVPAFRPPGEVFDLRFGSPNDLIWSADRSIGSYALYRGGLAALPGGDTGACHATGLTTTTAGDAAVPSAGAAFFYLVTARNRLGEESTKGFGSGGARRANPVPCE